MKVTSNDVIIKSWSELCEKLYDNSWQDNLGRFRSNYAFRGISNKYYDLKTSFVRRCGTHAHLEYHLLRNFRKYARIEGEVEHFSEWKWLTMARHYGLPTRLLDWTYSPFVAMHFATAEVDHYDQDAAIWHVDYVKVNRMLPSPLIDVLNDVVANVFTLEMVERALPDIKSFDLLGKDDLVMFFEPPSMDARIINQFAFSSVMSGNMARLDKWLETHPDLYRRVIIPKELKWEIRDKLDQANITERILFPGLDGLAAWLTRYYTPT